MIKLVNEGKAVLHFAATAFAIMVDCARIGTAYRNDAGPARGLYEFEDGSMSRARLIKTLAAR